MRLVLTRVGVVAALVALLAGLTAAGAARADDDDDDRRHGSKSSTVRFSTFNASLNRNVAGQLITDLSTPNNAQAKVIAEIVQRTRPDVLLINEFDFDATNTALNLFQSNYLGVAQKPDVQPIEYPYSFTAESNTGIPTGLDVDNNGTVGGPNDAFGFGFFPGQFGMAVYSKYPIQWNKIRTFQKFLWKDMPGALLPDNPTTPAPNDWYSPAVQAVFRLSSKSHWDIPISVKGKTVHFLTSHPTPPVFDDPPQFPAGVDFNGRRNFDEIRFWADYISGGKEAKYIYDDNGQQGGLGKGERFVIAGDQNSDPFDGDSIEGSAQLLLEHKLVNAKQRADEPRRTGAGGAPGPAERHPSGRPEVRHRGLRRRVLRACIRPGKPPRGLRAPAEEHEDPRLGHLLAAEHGSAVRARRDVPVPELGPQARMDRCPGPRQG